MSHVFDALSSHEHIKICVLLSEGNIKLDLKKQNKKHKTYPSRASDSSMSHIVGRFLC